MQSILKMFRPAIVGLCALLIMIGASGCGDPTVNDFVGAWYLSAGPDHPTAAKSSIDLRTDGGFSASQVPASMVGRDDAKTQLVNGSGTWKIKSINGQATVYLSFTKVDDTITQYGIPLEIGGLFGPPKLYYFLGDPDNRQTVEFQRK